MHACTHAHMHTCILMAQGGRHHFENGKAKIGHNKPLNTMQAYMFNSVDKSHAVLESLS